jgi:hypothetical protein
LRQFYADEEGPVIAATTFILPTPYAVNKPSDTRFDPEFSHERSINLACLLLDLNPFLIP